MIQLLSCKTQVLDHAPVALACMPCSAHFDGTCALSGLDTGQRRLDSGHSLALDIGRQCSEFRVRHRIVTDAHLGRLFMQDQSKKPPGRQRSRQ